MKAKTVVPKENIVHIQLKWLRKNSKLTQKQVADGLGYGITTINIYENGHRAPDTDFILAASRFYGVDPNFIFGCGVDKDVFKKSKGKDCLKKEIGRHF